VFLACGLDLYEDPSPIVVVKKTGDILKSDYESRRPSLIADELRDLASLHEKVMFCAVTEESARNFPEFIKHLREAHIVVKTYDLYDVLRMKNILHDVFLEVPLMAYCLAKMVQSEGLDFITYREEIQELYRLRELLDRTILTLSTIRAFPDDYHLFRDK